MTDERRPELQVLSGVECYRLLATQQVPRLGVDAGHYPLDLSRHLCTRRRGDPHTDRARHEAPRRRLRERHLRGRRHRSTDTQRLERARTGARKSRPLVVVSRSWAPEPVHRIPGHRVNAGAGYGSSRRGSVVGSCRASGRLRQPIRRDTRMDGQVRSRRSTCGTMTCEPLTTSQAEVLLTSATPAVKPATVA